MYIFITIAFVAGFVLGQLVPDDVLVNIMSAICVPFVFIWCCIWNPIRFLFKPVQLSQAQSVLADCRWVRLTKRIYFIKDPTASRIFNRNFFLKVLDN